MTKIENLLDIVTNTDNVIQLKKLIATCDVYYNDLTDDTFWVKNGEILFKKDQCGQVFFAYKRSQYGRTYKFKELINAYNTMFVNGNSKHTIFIIWSSYAYLHKEHLKKITINLG